MMEKKDTLSQQQKNSLDSLKIVNTGYLKTLDDLMIKYQKNIAPLNSQSEIFWNIANQLEKAHSQYPLGPYAHYYFRGFKEATEPFMDEWGNKSSNYGQITDEGKEIIEEKFPDYDNFNKLLQELITQLSDLLREIIARNFITTRFVGISDKYLELKECAKYWWVPQKIAQNKYSKCSVVTHEFHLPVTLPYHKELMIKYETLFNTACVIETKIKTIKGILIAIIDFIPFATLLPESQPFIKIENTATNSPLSVGDGNTFQKDAAIGQGAEIEKNN